MVPTRKVLRRKIYLNLIPSGYRNLVGVSLKTIITIITEVISIWVKLPPRAMTNPAIRPVRIKIENEYKASEDKKEIS